MQKVVIIVLAFFASCSTSQNKPTSDIPERREFPVSKEIKPCDDFYQYACSEALSNFKLRDDRSYHAFAFSDSRERILEKKKNYLRDLLTQTNFNERSQQLHDYYASCMDQDSRAREEKKILSERVNQLFSFKNKNEFINFLTINSLEGKDSHLQFWNDANFDNSNVYDFLIRPARLMSLPERSYYQNEKLMSDYKKLVSEFFQLAGFENHEERADWVIEFEKDYVNHYPPPAERRQLWTKRKYSTKSELRKLKNLGMNPVLKKVPSKIKIRNPMDFVFEYMNKKFADMSLEQLKTVYLHFSSFSMLDEGYPDFYKKRFAFNHKYLGGPEKRSVLGERCAEDMWSFNKEIDAELFDTIFPNFPEKKFVASLQRVKQAIIEGLKKNKWLSKKSKAGAIKKMKMAKFQVVKPKNEKEWDFNPKAKYDPKAYIANNTLLSKNLTNRNFERLPKKVNRDIWYMGPLTVNAYYDPSVNKFVMPAGILQYPFYDASLHEWQNLGAVGAVVGHELGHGVDDQGAQFDAKGRVKQWMSDEDIKKFKSRGLKLIDQFNKAGHNGELTLGENIGDLVGLTFAYIAAKKVMPEDEAARKQATREFYLQYARAWCNKARPKMIERILKTDPHSLGWARVNEQVKHQKAFAEAYSCKEGDKMVLSDSERIKIW